MKLTRWLVPVLVAVAWLGAVDRAAAVQAGGRPGARAGARAGQNNMPVVTPIELERWFDTYMLIQAQDTLKLTDAQFPRFLIKLKALQETRRRNLQARRQIVNALGRMLKASPLDEAQARDQLKSLRDLDARAAEELRKAYDGVDEVLETVQQARFRVFEEIVERRKIDLLLKARRNVTDPGRPRS